MPPVLLIAAAVARLAAIVPAAKMPVGIAPLELLVLKISCALAFYQETLIGYKVSIG